MIPIRLSDFPKQVSQITEMNCQSVRGGGFISKHNETGRREGRTT